MIDHNTVPTPIKQEIFEMYRQFLTKRHYMALTLTVEIVVQDTVRYGLNGNYDPVFAESDKKFGETEVDRIRFWAKVIRGDFQHYYDTLNPGQEMVVEGQKFII